MKKRTGAVGACPGVLVMARGEWLVTQSKEGLALARPHVQVVKTRRGVGLRLTDWVVVAEMPRDNITLAEQGPVGQFAVFIPLLDRNFPPHLDQTQHLPIDGVLCRSEGRLDMPLANRNKRSCSRHKQTYLDVI
jgi:hypothetical protein